MRAQLIEEAITLFTVINPIGVVPLSIAITRGMSPEERRRVARRGVVTAGVVLLVFIAVGEIVLDMLHVGLPAFRVAGGLILLLVALKMVLQETDSRHATTADGSARGSDVAVFPLAMPFLAGPGAIMAAVLLTENATFSVAEQVVTAGVVVLILVVTCVILLGADVIQGFIGATGAMVLTRVFGLVLCAMAAQTLLEGVRPFLVAVP